MGMVLIRVARDFERHLDSPNFENESCTSSQRCCLVRYGQVMSATFARKQGARRNAAFALADTTMLGWFSGILCMDSLMSAPAAAVLIIHRL